LVGYNARFHTHIANKTDEYFFYLEIEQINPTRFTAVVMAFYENALESE